jgi:hypothetical protein
MYKAIHPGTGALVDYPALLKSSESDAWADANAGEIGRLAQGYGKHNIPGTDTMHRHSQRPQSNLPQNHGRQKNRRQSHLSWRRQHKTADLATAKIMFKSIISTPDAKHMTINIKNFYLNTPMKSFEYMRIPVSHIPPDIMSLYALHDKVHNEPFTWKSVKECTAYHMPVALLMIASSCTSTSMATTKPSTPTAYSITAPATSLSP